MLKEMGVPAEWKHNKSGLAKKIAIAAVIGGAAVALIARARNDDDEDDR